MRGRGIIAWSVPIRMRAKLKLDVEPELYS
jgi:hypothetical protein